MFTHSRSTGHASICMRRSIGNHWPRLQAFTLSLGKIERDMLVATERSIS